MFGNKISSQNKNSEELLTEYIDTYSNQNNLISVYKNSNIKNNYV